MIQFNLLPDVKKEYIKANRSKKVIISTSLLISAISIAFLVVLFGVVQFGQKKNIEDLTKDIATEVAAINETANLTSILTTQNQLALLPGLHELKPETSRVFDVVKFVSPKNVRLETLDLSVEESTLTMTGNADSAASVNLFVDNIKAARYTTTNSKDAQKLPVFSAVNTTVNGDESGATFSIVMTYDPLIFDNKSSLYMAVGNQDLVEIIVKENKDE